jgi:hypothetical protein
MKSFKQYLLEIAIKVGGSDNIKAFMDDYYAQTQNHPFSNNTQIIHNVMLQVSPFDKEIHISDIQTMAPGTGAGSKALQFLKGLADKHHVTLSGFAKAYANDPKYITKNADLFKFYKSNGFTLGPSDGEGRDIKYKGK